MNLPFTWDKTAHGARLRLNRVVVGSVAWNMATSRDDPAEYTAQRKYVGSCSLPSLKIDHFYGPTEEDVQRQVEHVVTVWFEEALREPEKISGQDNQQGDRL